MTKITDSMRDNISRAIEQAEKNTTGEFVCVVAPSSARYVLFPLFWAAVMSIGLAGASQLVHLPFITPYAQAILFVVMVGLFTLGPFSTLLTPNSHIAKYCKRRAKEQFFAQRVHETSGRAGILFYVSLQEKFVDLVADKGINDKVEKDALQKIVDVFLENIRNGKTEEGFITAIQASNDVLAQHFPATPDDINELPDRLVELTKPELWG